MTQLGIAIYPHLMDAGQIHKQLSLALKYKYNHVYTTIQSPAAWNENNTLKQPFTELIHFCRHNNLILHVDINHTIMDRVKANAEDLSAFKKMGINIIRLDFGFENHEEVAVMTKNEDGVLIEDNASMQSDVIGRIKAIQRKGLAANYVAVHNFFPRPDTGLSFAHASEKAKIFKACGIRTGAFINSMDSPSLLFPQGHGLCTIENHRYKPSEMSVSELLGTNLYDFLFFGDTEPSEKELSAVSEIVHKNCVNLPAYFDENLDPEVLTIILNTIFVSRADQPEHVIRATQTRKCTEIVPFRCINRDKLCITMDNSLGGRYEGEIQIAVKDLPSNPYTNVIGQVDRLAENLIELIKYAKIPFRFIKK